MYGNSSISHRNSSGRNPCCSRKNAVYAEEILNQESAKEDATVIEPTEIDLGDYMIEMTVGEKQLLTTTV